MLLVIYEFFWGSAIPRGLYQPVVYCLNNRLKVKAVGTSLKQFIISVRWVITRSRKKNQFNVDKTKQLVRRKEWN